MKNANPSLRFSSGQTLVKAIALVFFTAGFGFSAEAQSYCSAGSGNPGTAGITKVVFNTINNSSSSSPAYTDFTALSTPVNAGSSQSLSVTITATGFLATNTAKAWIDWNQDGTFQATEEYDLGTLNSGLSSNTGLTSNSPLTFSIPANAPGGTTRMRIRTQRSGTPAACGNANNSETEDYTVNVIPLPVCSGTPAPGNTTTSNPTPCPGSSITLGIQFPSSALGLTYQWQSSTSGAGGPFANNGLGTAATQATSTTVPTWYRVNMTCSGNTGISVPVLVTPTLTLGCYCTVTANTDDNTGITMATFNTIANSSTGTAAYSNYTALSTTVAQTISYPLSVRVNTDGNYTVYAQAWIDWNQNGIFDAGEAYNLGSATNVADGATSASPAMIAVPPTAALGHTIMRIRATFSTGALACGNQDYSETEDYSINVIAAVPCSGTPAPGNTLVTATTPCPGSTFTLSAQNTFTETGLTYQWQSSISGISGPYANNGLGATATQATSATVPTWYRMNATCGINTGTSTPVLVTPTLNAACYCTVTATTDDGTGITNVSFNTLANTSTGTPAYSNYSAQSTTVAQGSSYPLNIRVNTAGNFTVQAKAWIDWDHSGTFDASEEYNLGSATNVTNGITSLCPLSITIPLTSLQGNTIMRIRARYNSAPTACNNNNYSEAEDYTLNVMPIHNTCATAYAVQCGQSYPGNTTGVAPSMPASACPFNGIPSTGGQNWWLYTATANQQITISTCGNASFDTRISVFTGTDCSSLACYAMNDDSPGCPSGSSTVSFNTTNGSTYWIAVHGSGAAEGSYQLAVYCGPICPPPANDLCINATAISNSLADGTGSPSLHTNGCSTGDAPTPISGPWPVQGVWFTFNSGTFSHALLTLLDHHTVPYTANSIDFTLYADACSNLGSGNSITHIADANGINLVQVTPNTQYRMLVYNTGGAGVAGTFGLLVQHPAHSDAAITAIISPAAGIYCGSQLAPQVTLKNNGDDNLTSVKITYGLSGGGSYVYNWTGNLAYGASVNVTLPTVPATAGNGQTLTVATSLPNGQADEITANDSQSVLLNVGGEAMVVKVFTGNDASGLSWTIFDGANNPVAQNGVLTNNAMNSVQLCLPVSNGSCYRFVLADDFGDGLCCANGNGFWELRTTAGGLLLRDLFDSAVDGFSSPSSSPLTPTYGSGHEFCLPPGPVNIVANECGVFNSALGNKVYCNKPAGATQYQFEFSNPDAGFLRRVTMSRNYVIYTELGSNITPGVKYFARVRTNVAGPLANAHWGTGCEMGLGVAQVVTCSELIQAPAFGHSCNENRAFNSNNSFIYAKPVNGANEYKFRIYIPGEGYDQTFTRSTYILQLKWNSSVAPPLVNGSTYSVQINTKVNGLYTGFCPSSCTITIDNSIPSMKQTAFGEATLWPNPVRDGQVNLSIGGIQDADQHISVDVQDLYGKQVFAQEFGNSGERFNTILQLPGTIASGVYLVGITIGNERKVQRLSIVK